MAKKKTLPQVVTVPIEPEGDFRRMAREAGPHTARTLSIAMDMLVFDAACYAALNGILSHHGMTADPKQVAEHAIRYAQELVEQRRAVKKA